MKSKTKNTVNIEIIKQITAKHFPKFNIGEVRELSGGMFNAAYLITGNNDNGDNNMVLKVGPLPGMPVLTYERDILRTEVEVYKKLPKDLIPVPQLLAADYSHSSINADYFFMQAMPGEVWKNVSKKFSNNDRRTLMKEFGRCNAAVHSISGNYFGYPKEDSRFHHSTWGDAFSQMVENILRDGEQQKMHLPYDSIRLAVEKHIPLLNKITTPKLVDFDMWAGNVFVIPCSEGYKISGIIDFERAFFGDPAADFTSAVMIFKDVEQEPEFLIGYESITGKALVITPDDRLRMNLYRLYMAIILNVETYRYNFAYAKAVQLYSKKQINNILKKL